MELRQVIEVMASSPTGRDARIASAVAEAATVYGSHKFQQAATALAEASAILPALDSEISQLREIADVISSSSRRMGGYM